MLLANAENWADKHADLKIRQTDMEFCMLLRLRVPIGGTAFRKSKRRKFFPHDYPDPSRQERQAAYCPDGCSFNNDAGKVLHCDGYQNRT